jgi:hypothetical protein
VKLEPKVIIKTTLETLITIEYKGMFKGKMITHWFCIHSFIHSFIEVVWKFISAFHTFIQLFLFFFFFLQNKNLHTLQQSKKAQFTQGVKANIHKYWLKSSIPSGEKVEISPKESRLKQEKKIFSICPKLLINAELLWP